MTRACGIARLQNGIELIQKLRAQFRFFRFGSRGGLTRFFRFGFRGALLIDGGGFVSRGLFGGGLRGLLLRNRGGGGLLGFRFLPGGIRRGFFRFLLHSNGFGVGGFRLQASLFGILTAFYFGGSLFFGGVFVRYGFCLPCIQFSFLFYGHHARFFRRFRRLHGRRLRRTFSRSCGCKLLRCF